MDKCPKCGSLRQPGTGFFDCWSPVPPNTLMRPDTSKECLRRQLAQRDSRIAELEAKLAAAARLAQDSAEAAGEMAGSKPSANDRAVERIRALCRQYGDGLGSFERGQRATAGLILAIINEEAAHD